MFRSSATAEIRTGDWKRKSTGHNFNPRLFDCQAGTLASGLQRLPRLLNDREENAQLQASVYSSFFIAYLIKLQKHGKIIKSCLFIFSTVLLVVLTDVT